jgi:hypothetical protein
MVLTAISMECENYKDTNGLAIQRLKDEAQVYQQKMEETTQ